MSENETSPPAVQTPAAEVENNQAPALEPQPEPAQAAETIEQFLAVSTEAKPEVPPDALDLAILEAIVYVTDEPLGIQQLANAMGKPVEHVKELLDRLVAEYNRPEHGLMVREVAGGYKMATKPEHHEAVRTFVKNLNPPLKLSLAALETLAVIAYKQPITAPEIMEIRGVQGAGVLKTLLDRKLITTSGRKNVVGRPILYKTTREFMVQFGLKDLNELPTLKEFEELRRLALGDDEKESHQAADGRPDDPESPGEAPVVPEQPPSVEPEPDSPGRVEPEPESPGQGDSEPESPGDSSQEPHA